MAPLFLAFYFQNFDTAPKNLSFYFQRERRLSLSCSFSVFPLQKQNPNLHPPSSKNEKAKRMVKGVATYFSMTLGASVFWQSMDEVHIRIALHQDEKGVSDAAKLGRKSKVGGIPYLSDFSPAPAIRSRTPPPPFLLHRHTGFLPSFSQTYFASLSSTTVLSSLTLTDEDLDKLGFEKIAEEFIEECKSEVLLLRH
ncbi:unnamed protein product [Malus baccata var. baccata]